MVLGVLNCYCIGRLRNVGYRSRNVFSAPEEDVLRLVTLVVTLCVFLAQSEAEAAKPLIVFARSPRPHGTGVVIVCPLPRCFSWRVRCAEHLTTLKDHFYYVFIAVVFCCFFWICVQNKDVHIVNVEHACRYVLDSKTVCLPALAEGYLPTRTQLGDWPVVHLSEFFTCNTVVEEDCTSVVRRSP